ncbi:hypothetical protein ACG0Z6_11935 [Roseateles sp. BYS180W]|uniref:Uncharacterized protein n=1 Tax=Roseateles rivi TaxID=3299028 RepID=A0ABW7FXB8_9BURK
MKPSARTPLLLSLPLAAVALSLACLPLRSARAAEADNLADYPTLERVLYVQECRKEHPGPEFEMTSKCVCALEATARQYRFSEYLTLSTELKGVSIGGERGGVLRDNDAVQSAVRRYRAQQAQAKQACFISTAR